VGDPFKDTSGPSMNILIKLTCLVGLVLAPILGNHSVEIENEEAFSIERNEIIQQQENSISIQENLKEN